MNKISRFSLSEDRLDTLLAALPKARLGLIGDACLDIYWFADMKRSELSRETPHFPLPVVKEQFSLGGAGNVAANMKALEVAQVKFISLAGQDWRASILAEALQKQAIDGQYIIQQPDIVTPSYCKPMRQGISDVVYEDPRIDFMNYAPISEESEDKILRALDAILPHIDVLAVSDQLPFGCVTPRIREKILAIGQSIPVIVDSRDRISQYHSVTVKPNEVEAGILLNQNLLEGNLEENLLDAGKKLYQKTNRPVIITLGGEGSFYYDKANACIAPGQKVTPPIDFVGAGDTFLSALCAALAVGATGPEAIAIGNLASAVIIKKIGITGVATAAEIKQRYQQSED